MKKALILACSIAFCGIDNVTAMEQYHKEIAAYHDEVAGGYHTQKIQELNERYERYFGTVERYGDYDKRVIEYAESYAVDLHNLLMRSATCEKVKEYYTERLRLEQIEEFCKGVYVNVSGFDERNVLFGTTSYLTDKEQKEFKDCYSKIALCWNAYNRGLEQQVNQYVKNFLQTIMNRCIRKEEQLDDSILNVSSYLQCVNWEESGYTPAILVRIAKDLCEEKNLTDLKKCADDFLKYLIEF